MAVVPCPPLAIGADDPLPGVDLAEGGLQQQASEGVLKCEGYFC